MDIRNPCPPFTGCFMAGWTDSERALSSHPAGREIMFKSLSHVNHCSEVGAFTSSFLTVTRKVPNCTKKRSIPSSYGAGWHDQKLLLIMPEALQTARSAPPIQIPKFVGRRLAGAHFSCHCSCSRPLPAPPLVPRKMWHSGQTNNNGVSRGTQRRGQGQDKV